MPVNIVMTPGGRGRIRGRRSGGGSPSGAVSKDASNITRMGIADSGLLGGNRRFAGAGMRRDGGVISGGRLQVMSVDGHSGVVRRRRSRVGTGRGSVIRDVSEMNLARSRWRGEAFDDDGTGIRGKLDPSATVISGKFAEEVVRQTRARINLMNKKAARFTRFGGVNRVVDVNVEGTS